MQKTKKATADINFRASLLCMVFWISSYIIPLYFLPETLFALLWLATITWGIVLSGGLPVFSKEEAHQNRSSWQIFVAIAIVAGLLFYTYTTPINTLLILIGILVFIFGRYNNEPRWLRSLLMSIVIAAVISVWIALIQLLYPGVDLALIAPLAYPNRATANLRQPNLFAQLLLLGIIGWIFLRSQFEKIPAWAYSLVAGFLGAGIAFSQSRTGFLGLFILVIWTALDSKLPSPARRTPLKAAAGCAVAMSLMLLAAHSSGQLTHFEIQQGVGSDISSSRFGIWKNTLSLIAMHPWTGVGWGNFAIAWNLTPFPGRPSAAFDNAHNLPMHLLVELGIPLAVSLMGLAGWAIWRARHALKYAVLSQEDTFRARCLFMMMCMLGLHSLLEYPLWYTFFLFPAAFIAGQFLQIGDRAARLRVKDFSSGSMNDLPRYPAWTSVSIKILGISIVFGSIYAAWDYSRVIQAFTPFGYGFYQDLQTRVNEARKSFLFGDWVDYAVVGQAESFAGLDAQMERAVHTRMNSHLLMAYARYLNERGETDKASYVADRLREFKKPEAEEFFAVCQQENSEKPFQCRHPKGTYSFRDFK